MQCKYNGSALLVVGASLIVALLACAERSPGPVRPAATTPKSVGQLHNEFLDMIQAESAHATTDKSGISAPFAAAQRMAAQYDLPPLTRDEVRRAIDRGVQWAQRDPDALVRELLSKDEYQWWWACRWGDRGWLGELRG